jgi:hypothetical protein
MDLVCSTPSQLGEQEQIATCTCFELMFDFYHAKLVFYSSLIGIKPITLEEHHF